MHQKEQSSHRSVVLYKQKCFQLTHYIPIDIVQRTSNKNTDKEKFINKSWSSFETLENSSRNFSYSLPLLFESNFIDSFLHIQFSINSLIRWCELLLENHDVLSEEIWSMRRWKEFPNNLKKKGEKPYLLINSKVLNLFTQINMACE